MLKMKILNLTVLSILFCAAITARSSHPAAAYAEGAEPGICEFTTAAPKTEKDKPPQYKAVSEIQCGEFPELYAVCGLTKPIDEYKQDALKMEIVFTDTDFSREQILTIFSSEGSCAEFIPDGETPGEIVVVYVQGLISMDELCALPERNENKPVDADVYISTGVQTGTEKQKSTDGSGKEIERDIPVYDWTKIAAGRVKIIPEEKKKTIQPPNWESVEDELRSYWPTRYPGFEFIDGYPTDPPRAETTSGYTIFTYNLSVIVTDETGAQTTCSIDNAAIKQLDTGGIVVHNIEFDRFQDCAN
jgi:hypothetical protein